MISIALNGCGRIGKTFLRIICSDPEAQKHIRIKAINIGPADLQALEYLIKYDSILKTYDKPVKLDGTTLSINGQEIAVFTETDAKKLPWKSLGIDWVVDASGHYTKREKAQEHLDAGAQNVLISAPAHGDDITIIPGVNSAAYDKNKHRIVSLGSCTTNAAVPVLHVLAQAFNLESVLLSTVHAYTNTQALLDVNPQLPDLRRSRAAALNIVPTTTGATETVVKVLPELRGKLAGLALRVPTPVVSLLDICFVADKPIEESYVRTIFATASAGTLKNIMTTSDVPLVSTDYQGNAHSVIIDFTMLSQTGRMGRVFGWYDNEYGYSMRLRDFLMFVAK
jgi:glyceraldehyde 3-phosphate dehydrogenase